MYPEAPVAEDRRKRRAVLLTALVLGAVALAFYIGTFLLRHYGMYQ